MILYQLGKIYAIMNATILRCEKSAVSRASLCVLFSFFFFSRGYVKEDRTRRELNKAPKSNHIEKAEESNITKANICYDDTPVFHTMHMKTPDGIKRIP